MVKKKLLLSLLSVVAVLAFSNKLAVAQARPESDPRFEKLAKEFYPKAKQEGALSTPPAQRNLTKPCRVIP
jgi:hypothetical protein